MKSSVSKIRWGWVVMTLLVAIAPLAARAGMGHRRCGGHCGRCTRAFAACQCAQPFCSICQMAPSGCNCQQPAIVGQAQVTTLQPVVMQPVVRTEIRRQAQVVDVPVTTLKQVTVDEGAYQTVWVPKLTTKTVAETSVQKQVRYQDVPYQVVQQVPVPSRIAAPVILSPGTTAFAPQTIMPGTPVMVHGDHVHPVPGMGASASTIPGSLIPTPEPYFQTQRSPAQTPVAADTGSWSKVPPRQASAPASPSGNGIRQQAYQVEVSTVSQARPTSSIPATRPSAAAVWQARSAFSAR